MRLESQHAPMQWFDLACWGGCRYAQTLQGFNGLNSQVSNEKRLTLDASMGHSRMTSAGQSAWLE